MQVSRQQQVEVLCLGNQPAGCRDYSLGVFVDNLFECSALVSPVTADAVEGEYFTDAAAGLGLYLSAQFDKQVIEFARQHRAEG